MCHKIKVPSSYTENDGIKRRHFLWQMDRILYPEAIYRQVDNIRNNFPIQNAKVSISSKGEPERVLEQLTTDSSGQTENISLPAPPEEYSLEPGIYQPYSEYDVLVEAEGFKPLNISGTEILAGTQAIQPAALTGDEGGTPPEDPVVIPDHTLFGNYPPKIAEAEVKPVKRKR